jgi:NADPH-dependent ferric siderophore reductase
VPGERRDGTPRWAYYTVRRWRPDDREVDMWFVLHEPEGPVSGWAAGASPGDTVSLWGPRTSFHPPAGTRSLLLVADDTGLPAVAAILDDRDEATTARVVIEAHDRDHAVELALRPGDEIHWMFRDGREPGTGGGLADAVAEMDLDTDGLYAFGAAESREITAVRRLLRGERGMAQPNVQMTGYWRRQRAERPLDEQS